MKLIPLSKYGKHKGKYFVKVDDADYDWLIQYNWSITSASKKGYAFRKIKVAGKKKNVLMHKLILGIADNQIGDHIDRDKLNCQRSNLRVCTIAQNNMNAKVRSDNKSGFKGVSWHAASNKWAAWITTNGVSINLGLFLNKVDAAKAYDEAAIIYHKEFANLNFKQ